MTTTATPEDESRSPALVQAEIGTEAWSATVRHQRWATPDHADFYALAGELVTTLYALEDLSGVLTTQVAGYATGRALYDDTHQVDPAATLAAASAALTETAAGLRAAVRAGNEFWSQIGHIGVEVDR